MEMQESLSSATTESPSAVQKVPNKLGHQRHSSISKPMPVTSFVLSFPTTTSYSKNYNRISRDGLSPDFEKSGIFFHVTDSDLNLNESDVKRRHTSKHMTTEALRKSNSSPVLTSEGESETNEFQLKSDCSNNNVCSEECKSNQCKDSAKQDLEDLGVKQTGKSHLKVPPSKIDEKRKEFLNELLNAAVDDDDADDAKEGRKGGTEELRAEQFTIKDFREKFAIAEALAKTSMMTSPAAKRRLAARKIEMELDGCGFDISEFAGDDEMEYVPPKQLLLYLVRMGSFNSAPKINNPDCQDDRLEVPQGLSTIGLMQYCKMMRGENQPQLLERCFLKPNMNKTIMSTDLSDGLRVLKLDTVSKACSAPVTSPNQLRILQWNILSQCLGQNNDGFVKCPDEALTWEHRKYLIVEEIVRNNPDVICLQEVDHYKFLERMLGSQNYTGIFFPKPDSPCLYIQDNNGPDGCAIFYKRDKFELVNFDTRVLEVWRVQSNQVAIVANLRVRDTGKEICVCTTHLKARNGALLSKLRNEQGKDLLRFVNAVGQGRPVIMSGDFNAEPIEPIYSTVLNYRTLGLSSAYADLNEPENKKTETNCNGNVACKGGDENEENYDLSPAELSASREPPYTTWKIREEGEVCHTIDYVFYSKKYLKVKNCLQFPKGNEIGMNRTPSYQYPSDHFALVCDLEFREDAKETIS